MKKFSSLSELKSLINPDEIIPSEPTSNILKTPIKKQHLEAHYSVKGRAGKPVTVIKGFNCSIEEIKDISKLLKSKLSVGGSVKNKQIIIQGKLRDKVMLILEKLGHNVKRVGG
ncbi:MAG: translation initiation factor [Flavobacteriales bacterium]|nr:MAG: translation initiation factor [Flavobacteriales bacterium]